MVVFERTSCYTCHHHRNKEVPEAAATVGWADEGNLAAPRPGTRSGDPQCLGIDGAFRVATVLLDPVPCSLPACASGPVGEGIGGSGTHLYMSDALRGMKKQAQMGILLWQWGRREAVRVAESPWQVGPWHLP